MHNYYQYGAEQLLSAPKIPLEVLEDDAAVFQAMANEMAEIILAKADAPCVLICPVGPVGHYPYFVERVNREGISLRHCWFINMDEYLDENLDWVPKTHPLSFRGFMEREVYGRIRPECNVPEEQRIFPDPHHPEAVPELISRLGGVDAAFGGIGINGHLAFNEAQPDLPPEEFLKLKTRVLEISPETRAANAIGDLCGALEDMPTRCVTVGFAEIFGAKRISLGVFRPWHRAVVRRAAYGAYSAAFPVSLLQGREDTVIRMPRRLAE